jgi:hypothetical protein
MLLGQVFDRFILSQDSILLQEYAGSRSIYVTKYSISFNKS